MARMRFGGGPQDVYMFEDTDGDLHAGGGFNALMYESDDPGAAPITDLLTDDGEPATYITTSDGSTAPDGPAAGQLPIFWGPDGVYEMWTSINSSPRVLLTSTNLGSYFGPTKTQVDELLGSGNPNPLNIAFSSLIGIDAESIDTAPVGSTLIKQLDGEYGAGGAPIPLADTLWVAASDAPDSFDPAPYVCDGTADNVQIQAAIDNAFGMRVGLSPGTFAIAAPVNLIGPNNATLVLARYLTGSGESATKLVAGSGVTSAIFMGSGVSAHVSDLTIAVTGSTRAIYTEKTPTAGAELRGWYNGSIRRVNVTGPNDGTHSTFAISLKTCLQFTVEDVHITGCGMGIEVTSEDGSFTAGYGLISRCHVGVIGANAIAYRIGADAGKVKMITMANCSAFVDPVYSNSVAFLMSTPTGEVSAIRIINGTARGFYRSLLIDALAYECFVDFGYAQLKTGGQFARVAGFANKVSVSELQMDSGATATAISDVNALATLPNEYQVHAYAATGSLTSSVGNGVVTRGLVEGGATFSDQLRVFPGQARRTAGPWTMSGSLSGKVGAGVFSWYNESGYPVYIRSVRAVVGTAPTGSSIIVDVNINGTTAFTTQANRPTIAISGTTSGKVTNMNVLAVPDGGRISVDIDQVGSTVAGSDLTVQIEVQ